MSAAGILATYQYLAEVSYFGQAVCMHGLFGVVLWLVFSGNRRPGWLLMSLTFTSMAFSVFWTTLERGLTVLAIAFLVLAFCAGYDAVRPLTAWGLGKQRPPWIRRSAYVALAWSWIYPHHVPWWKALVGAPLGILPAPTLLALLAMLWLAFPQTNRLLHWAAAILGVLYGLVGVFYLRVVSDVVLVGVAGASLHELIRAVKEAGGLMEEDLTPTERPKDFPERTKKNPVWRI